MKRCRRQCIEARSADQSARSAEKFFRLHFSLLRMGSRGTFALCTASSRCTRIAGPRAGMSFFLAYFAHERNTYVHGGVYWMVVSFPSRSVSGNARYCELRRPWRQARSCNVAAASYIKLKNSLARGGGTGPPGPPPPPPPGSATESIVSDNMLDLVFGDSHS